MTISLENHVAELAECLRKVLLKLPPETNSMLLSRARAAIAAVREREGAECGGAATHSKTEYVQPDPAEDIRARCEAIARKLAGVNKRNGDTAGWLACEDVAEDIAALKGAP